jgi:hypothetical protein
VRHLRAPTLTISARERWTAAAGAVRESGVVEGVPNRLRGLPTAVGPSGVTGDVYTHGHHESVLRSHRWRTAENSAGYLLPSLRQGMAVVDVGCGPGTITIATETFPGRTGESLTLVGV